MYLFSRIHVELHSSPFLFWEFKAPGHVTITNKDADFGLVPGRVHSWKPCLKYNFQLRYSSSADTPAHFPLRFLNLQRDFLWVSCVQCRKMKTTKSCLSSHFCVSWEGILNAIKYIYSVNSFGVGIFVFAPAWVVDHLHWYLCINNHKGRGKKTTHTVCLTTKALWSFSCMV